MTNNPNAPRSARKIDRLIGQRVRDRRLSLGLSQEHVGEMLGLSFQQVQKYERGANRISISRLIEICRCLGVPVSYFVDGVEGDYAQPVERSVSRTLDIKLLSMFHGMADNKTKRLVLDLMRALAGADEGGDV